MSKDFIGVYENAIPDEICDNLIADFEKLSDLGMAIPRSINSDHSKSMMDDSQMFLSDMLNASATMYYHDLNNLLWINGYEKYAQEYAILENMGDHRNYSIKLQKTEVGQGYHVWHCEAASRASCHRVMAWIAYLNDVDDGGETEFLYQHRRVKPKKGTLVMFPSGFTHTHRGNPPLSNTKYIATGWLEF